MNRGILEIDGCQRTIPNETGFSNIKVKYMMRWWLFYYERIAKSQQLVDQLMDNKKGHQFGDLL